MEPKALGLGGDVPTRLERIMKQLKIGFFKEGSRGPDRVRRIGDDHIITRRVVCKEFEAIANEDLDFRRFEKGRHMRKVLLGNSYHCLGKDKTSA